MLLLSLIWLPIGACSGLYYMYYKQKILKEGSFEDFEITCNIICCSFLGLFMLAFMGIFLLSRKFKAYLEHEPTPQEIEEKKRNKYNKKFKKIIGL